MADLEGGGDAPVSHGGTTADSELDALMNDLVLVNGGGGAIYPMHSFIL